jgi:hypothetical protein
MLIEWRSTKKGQMELDAQRQKILKQMNLDAQRQKILK